MDGRVRALALDEADQRSRCCVHDGERVAIAGAEGEATGRGVAALPDKAGRSRLELGEDSRAIECLWAKRVGVNRRERPFVRRRVDVRIENPRVRVVEPRCFDPALKQRFGIVHEELVEGVFARNQNGETVAASARTAPLLSQRGDGAGKADRDGAIELTDVDPELERIGRRDTEQITARQARLDLAPLRGRVAGAIWREPGSGRRVHALCGEAVDELGCLAALGETDRS